MMLRNISSSLFFVAYQMLQSSINQQILMEMEFAFKKMQHLPNWFIYLNLFQVSH